MRAQRPSQTRITATKGISGIAPTNGYRLSSDRSVAQSIEHSEGAKEPCGEIARSAGFRCAVARLSRHSSRLWRTSSPHNLRPADCGYCSEPTLRGWMSARSTTRDGRAAAPAHDLRKSAVVFLLEAGLRRCRDRGHRRPVPRHYAKQVNQRRLAAAAILKWETADAARAAKKKARVVQPPSEFVQQDEDGATQAVDSIGTASWARTRDPQIHNLVL